MKSILFIAPLPPPINGHSLISKQLVDNLKLDFNVRIGNMSKQKSSESITSFNRIREILSLFLDVFKKRKNNHRIYFTISESLAGNLKDLIIYLICFGSLHKMYIHLHGGSIKKLLFDKNRLIKNINHYFYKKIGGIIISGNSHSEIFETVISKDKLHILCNHAPKEIFVKSTQVVQKFEQKDVLNIIYVSAMYPDKGYNDLLEGYKMLNTEQKSLINLSFAGRFDDENLKEQFVEKVKIEKNVYYHGIVDKTHKQQLFAEAHVFYLPTKYFEGQPISILEAYASGCAVVTTAKGGIVDIFDDKINGLKISENDPKSIYKSLVYIIENKKAIREIAVNNHKYAVMNYLPEIYFKNMRQILNIG